MILPLCLSAEYLIIIVGGAGGSTRWYLDSNLLFEMTHQNTSAFSRGASLKTETCKHDIICFCVTSDYFANDLNQFGFKIKKKKFLERIYAHEDESILVICER